ncbi:MarR family transcriptional regulator [Amycolatopsis mediterranei S699]|uniref:MarR family transcriptional regulator n=2 Tax=Amycolatopsis mediterranei TaxID=33910 RepID=A0A0H3D3H4_AMYMU|nr:MarR family transcriptional regulator [Amycolatopsis mediterranei]ADJ44722.1 MarR family transcriptional regulator [Amycolatopsis mediterranei U32]AEK41465.1 MarR family transcriptional regulator [Amycolatopsis mediterranei S699]AFO76433.1 MarR family transcriptional regulator [Amycolatopsis mediterranei S699]AGT83562.1 MarR family transcriptional regulator [Amycolatopsis mediterranei RB]KDO07455.1 MarR family transcriptional regulator [Amycolatopsis mediterranei]
MRGKELFPGLGEDEQRAWINLVKVLLSLPGALESQLLRDADLTLLGYMILARLSMVPGESLRMSQIAEMANGSLPRISHAVARLEDRGWVTREVCTGQGRRFTTATLTEAGRAHLAASAPAHLATVRRLVLDPLGEDFVPVGAAVERIVENLGLPTEILKSR